MNSILFSEENKKQQIVALLTELENGTYSINQLVQRLPFSKETTLFLIEEINKDFQELFDYHLLNPQHKVIWSNDFFEINKYNQFLVQKSLPYQFILHMLMYPKFDLKDFSKKFFISVSSVRRLLRPFIASLERYNIRIRLSSMTVEGQEFEIRAMFHSILWIGSLGVEIMAILDSEDEMTLLKQIGFYDSIHINTNEALVFLLISKLRIEQEHYVDSFPLKAVYYPPKETVPMKHYLEKQKVPACHLETEMASLTYKMFYSETLLDIKDFRVPYLTLYMETLTKQNDELQVVLDELLTLLKDEGDISDPDSLQLISLNFYSAFLLFHLENQATPALREFQQEEALTIKLNPQLASVIKVFLTKVIRRTKFKWAAPTLNELTRTIVYIIQPYWQPESIVVNVGITPIPNSQLVQELLQLFSLLSFVNTTFEDKASTDIDLFISPFKEQVPDPDVPFFLVPISGLTDKVEQQLFAQLLNIFQKKFY